MTLADNPHTAISTAHLTFPIDYTKTIKMVAGATVTLTMSDFNCVMMMNCGPTAAGTTCKGPLSVSLANSTPAAPASFTQPFAQTSGGTTRYGQWLFFDITDVALIP